MTGSVSRHRSSAAAVLAVVAAMVVISPLYVFRLGARSPLEFYGLTALLIAGGVTLGGLYAKRRRLMRPAQVLLVLAGAGLALLLAVALTVVGLLFVSDG